MATHKITKSEQQVLNKLIYPETFQNILDEIDHTYGELRDDLINLLSFNLIEAYEREGNKISLTSFYDADNLQDFTFRATSKGIKKIKSR